jgi:hypothetical protein
VDEIDMSPLETGKQRAARIPLDYYKRPTFLERWKDRLGGIAFLIALGWLGVGLFQRDQGQLRYSRGPVATVHQTWDANCTVCHEPFAPIQSDHWATGLFTSAKEQPHRCETCHAGPIHHANEKAAFTCAGCHREHRGRDASLVRLDDSFCTHCHLDLPRHTAGGDLKFAKNVSRFSYDGHPEVRFLKETSAVQKLKFNHKLHMAAGMATPEKGDPNLTLGRLPAAQRKRYEGQQEKKGDDARVQLQCASCHQLDSGDVGVDAAGLPQRSAGDYMLPINYEAHCQACHPLTFERKETDDPRSGHLEVRHGLQPAEIRQLLEGVYIGKALNNDLKVFEQFVPARPLPGKKPSEEQKKLRELIDQKISAAERSLYVGNKTCGECHHLEPKDLRLDEALKPGAEVTFRIAPPRVPQVWFAHALFNHAAHRGVDCRGCHEQGYAEQGQKPPMLSESQTSDDILIPGKAKCLECHSPPTTSGGQVRGGARHDCTECHRYHHGAGPLQGIGAAARNPQSRRAVDDFLSGTRSRK